jgi:hypothetical protein
MPSGVRVTLGILAALVLGLGAPAPASAGTVQAREAAAFVDSIGVDVHTAFSDTPYVSEFATVKQRLGELGVHHVRDDLFLARPDQYQRLDELAQAGIGSTLVMGSPKDGGVAGLETRLGIAEDLEGLEAAEGPNEYSTTSGDVDWVEHLREYQEALYAKVKATPALATLPVVGPSLVHNDQSQLGDISPSLDFGNIHSYPQGEPPDKLGTFINKAKLNSGSKPIVATETGYNTAAGWKGENPAVSEAAMATYVPRLFLEYFRWGIVRTFSYELLDEFPDPGDREANFGLLRNDLSPKPAFDALRNTIEILADPGSAFAPGALDYTLSEGGVPLSGPEGNLHRVLLQKRDGSFYLALWRLSSVWDPAAQAPLPAIAEPLEVSVAPGLVEAAEYLPSSSPQPHPLAIEPGQPLTVDVGPAVTILRLVPGIPPVSALPLPPSDSGSSPPSTQPEPSCVVPRLHGRRLSGGRVKLRLSHCRLGRVSGARAGASRVIGQRPRPGRVLAAGSRVDVALGTRPNLG